MDKKIPLLALNNVREVGIVYNVFTCRVDVLTEVVHYFESEGKKVFTLGFIDDKEFGNRFTDNREYFFCRKQLSFWKIPKREAIDDFLKHDFDYLLNLDIKGELALQSISTFSTAKIRMGKHFDNYAFAQDFMIGSEVKSEKELFEEFKKYIT